MRQRREEQEAVSAVSDQRVQREVLQSLQSLAKFTSTWSNRSEASNVVDTETYILDPAKEEREADKEYLASLESLHLQPETTVRQRGARIIESVPTSVIGWSL